jgi:hypothetical protein
MRIALATGWTPDVVRDLTFSELRALSEVMKERNKALRAR